ncbi:MAG: cobyrinate a,c-diamide synthase [Porphyromonadaceae bacterium]|nr:cobyrinate a,c-diamide synthase [Porphyromonadaceae bacterium]
MIPQCLVAAASSGSGKTTFTLGLLRALNRRGLTVQGFKCGPDYIDPKFHRLACGRESVNLDLFMMSPEHVQAVYARHSAGSDAAVLEGVMGLYDGYVRDQGSSAEVAATLGLPTILLIDARSSAFSVGAILYGMKHFRPTSEVVGVVFNRVASESHYRFLREAAEEAGVVPLGYLPKTQLLEVPSRHLGLSLEELSTLDALPETVADLIEQHVQLDRLLELIQRPRPVLREEAPLSAVEGMKVAVARDQAFNFIYAENLRRLSQLGELVYFSPLANEAVPASDLVYLPGGYPEFYLDQLATADQTRLTLRDHVQRGGKILAECGGMMYLCRELRDEQGQAYPMAGILELEATMEQMRLRLGYRKLLLGGQEWRGHEFHYSRIATGEEPTKGQQRSARDEEVPTLLYAKDNVRAGYTHLYFGEANPLDLFC